MKGNKGASKTITKEEYKQGNDKLEASKADII